MKRSTPLRPGKPLTRKSRLRSSAPPRATGRPSQRFAKRRDAKYAAWIRTLPCELGKRLRWWTGIPCDGPVECAHIVTRGAGGYDVGNCIPLCRFHHRLQHRIGIKTFQTHFEMDLVDLAAELAVRAPVRSGTPTYEER